MCQGEIVSTFVAPTLLIERVSSIQHNTDMCDYIQSCHFLKSLPVLTCQYCFGVCVGAS